MAKALHENVQDAVGVEMNEDLHRLANVWVSEIKKLDFVLGSYLTSATFIHADMFDESIEAQIKAADVIFCNNLLFDDMHSTRGMQATSTNGKLCQMLDAHMVKTGTCIVTTFPIGRVGSRFSPTSPDRNKVPQKSRMGLTGTIVQCHKFEFPDRSFQWTNQSLETSKPQGYISIWR